MISLLCPSRARPERFRKMAESAFSEAAAPGLVGIELAVDADDPTRERYEMLARQYAGVRVTIMHERKSVPAILNAIAMRAPGEILFTVADDVVFQTRAWDRMLLELFASYPDRILVAWTNDGLNRDKCQHWATSRAVVDALGYFCWPQFEHFYGDEMIETIAKAVGRGVYLRELVTRHEHFKHRDAKNEPLAPRDETYAAKRVKDRQNQSMTDRDGALFRRLDPEIKRAAVRLAHAIRKSEAA